MNIQDYEFNIGDEVITSEGEKGAITRICTCSSCERRGFYEPFWADENDCWEHCISIYDAESGFSNFYKIGKYKFNNIFDKAEVLRTIECHEEELKKLRNQLKVIEELENDD